MNRRQRAAARRGSQSTIADGKIVQKVFTAPTGSTDALVAAFATNEATT